MTRDDIIRMAVKCWLINAGNREGLYMDALAEFAALVATAEREACAKMVEPLDESLADAIRARGQK
jgi:hypothetical protein